MNVVIVPGIRVSDPMRTIGKVGPLLAEHGIKSHVFYYGRVPWFDTRFGNEKYAEALRSHCLALRAYGEPLVVIAHSNGCALAHRAAWLFDEHDDDPPGFEHVVYLSPALDRSVLPAPAIKRCDVFHTRHDWAVRASRLLFGHVWGDQGALGFCGDDRRVHNVDGTAYVDGHSAWFDVLGLEFLRERLVRPLLEMYGRT